MTTTQPRQLIVVDSDGGVHNCGTLLSTSQVRAAADGTVTYTLTAQLHPDADNRYGWPYLMLDGYPVAPMSSGPGDVV